MAVIAHVTIPGLTLKQYDELRDVVGWLEEVPVGGIAHLVWEEADGLHGTDVWESEEAFAAFGQDRLGPGMAKLGIAAVPQVSFQQAHEVYLPRPVTIT
jgi:hypothetical protein